MATEPGARFASATAMARALRDALATTPDPSDAAPTVPHALGSSRRVPRVADTEVAPVPSAPRPPAAKSRRPGRRFTVALVGAAVAVLLMVGVVAGVLATRDDGSGDPPPTTGSGTVAPTRPATTGSVPAPLDRALDRLDRAVSP
jgi:hypothetical protein